jgi:hypothetical protein
MENGWIKINRSLKKKGYYTQSEYVHLWVHLLLSVNHEETEFLWNGKILKIKRGQFVTGRKKLALETGIAPSTVERILKLFESEQQIEQQTTTKYRLITVINYAKYQQYEQQNGQQTDNKRTASGQQTDTNNKLKNIERDKGAEKIDLPDWLDKGSWTEWVAYRKGRKLTTNEKTMKKQIDFLAENRAVHKEIINQSIMNGWQGLFPLKANGTPPVKKPESGKYAGLGTKINV